jgi:hypothetical protein
MSFAKVLVVFIKLVKKSESMSGLGINVANCGHVSGFGRWSAGIILFSASSLGYCSPKHNLRMIGFDSIDRYQGVKSSHSNFSISLAFRKLPPLEKGDFPNSVVGKE